MTGPSSEAQARSADERCERELRRSIRLLAERIPVPRRAGEGRRASGVTRPPSVSRSGENRDS